MNSESVQAPAPRSRARRFSLALLCLLAVSGNLLTGCANMKQYSIDSWAGPMPMHDLKYLEEAP